MLKNRVKVPRYVSLETLVEFAIIVNEYECHGEVEVFVDIWLKAMENNLLTFYGKKSMLWLLVSWVEQIGLSQHLKHH